MTRTCLGRPTLKKTMFIRNVNLKQLMFITPLFSNHLTHCQLMSLGTGAIKGRWGPHENTGHSSEQAATNQHHHTEGTSVQNLTWPETYHEPLPIRGGKSWHWIGDQSSDPQSSTEQANCKYGDQSSDPSEVVIYKDQQRRQLQLWCLELTWKHTTRQAHDGHPTDQRDHWTRWLEIKFA